MKKGQDFTGVCIVYYCHDGAGNFVMHKRNSNCRDEHGAWDVGGGGVDFGEKIEEALCREIMEEYCTDVINVQFLGFRDVHREHQGMKTHWIALDYKVLVDRDKVSNGEPHKHDDVSWHTLEKCPTPLHSQLSTFFLNYKKQLID